MKAATKNIAVLTGYTGFQSTPPVKAATLYGEKELKMTYISIHAAREGGDASGIVFWVVSTISIHAAREGGDGWRVTS